MGDHYECKYSVGASQTAQVGAGCSNRYATCSWAEQCPSASCKAVVSICRIIKLNYYNTHYQYKCAIAMIWGYGILYLQFGATLHVNTGLIKFSVTFKIVKWAVPQGQSPQTLYYIILYYVTLFYGFNTLVFCNLHCIYVSGFEKRDHFALCIKCHYR